MSRHRKPVPVYAVHAIKLWAPLALGLMAARIEALLPDAYQVIYPFAESWDQLREQMAEHGSGPVLFSNYMWTREANLEISALLKAYDPQAVVIHGGPDTPAYAGACEAYLRKYPAVDFAVHGEGEQTLLELLAELLKPDPELESLAGIGFLQAGHFVKTAGRQRSADPNLYPSPYLKGNFERLPWQGWNAITLETNRGCPYGCAFCDWGSATLQKIRLFDLERIRAEIEWAAQHKIPKLWIADSNFGIFERDLEITKMICEIKEQYGYPRSVITNYAKNTKQHLVDIIEMLVDHGLVGTGIVSLQTRDQETLKTVRRSNVKTREYDRLREAFESRKLPMSTQLMIGLPGSTRESFKADLRFFFNQNIDVQIFRTVVLPNAPMAAPEYLTEHQLEFDESGMLLSSRLLSRAELNHIEQMGRLFRCAHTYGMFRYWLCFLQWDYAIDPIDYLDALASAAAESEDPLLAQFYDRETPPHDLLTSHAALREEMRASSGWETLYRKLKAFTLKHYPQVRDDAALETVLRVQSAVMPTAKQTYPLVLELPHDFVRYYASHRQGTGGLALSAYEPGVLRVSDPIGLSASSLSEHLRSRDRPVVVWELQSELSPEGTEATLFVAQVVGDKAARTS